jgi:3-hydroxyacyl-CoA dehydrogenase
VKAGRLGRKSGRGVYAYPEATKPAESASAGKAGTLAEIKG